MLAILQGNSGTSKNKGIVLLSFHPNSGLRKFRHSKSMISQSIKLKFVERRYTTRPGAPTVTSGKHDQKVHA